MGRARPRETLWPTHPPSWLGRDNFSFGIASLELAWDEASNADTALADDECRIRTLSGVVERDPVVHAASGSRHTQSGPGEPTRTETQLLIATQKFEDLITRQAKFGKQERPDQPCEATGTPVLFFEVGTTT